MVGMNRVRCQASSGDRVSKQTPFSSRFANNPFHLSSQIPELLIIDSDSDQPRDSFDSNIAVEDLNVQMTAFQNFCDAKSKSPKLEANVTVVELSSDEGNEERHLSVEELTLRPIAAERKRVASSNAEVESASHKRHVKLLGLGSLKLLSRRE
jgi:hypothetical protein